jgi:hypothetical protein
MADKIRPLKLEDNSSGSQLDFGPTEMNPLEDLASVKGVSFEGTETVVIIKDGNDMKFSDLNTNYVNNLEEVAFGGGHYFTGPAEYVRVPVGHNHFVYQEVDIEGEYEILGELVCQE